MGVCLILLGSSLFWYPAAAQWRLDRAAVQCIAAFEENTSGKDGQMTVSDSMTAQEKTEELYESIRQYNQLLYTQGQISFNDPRVVAQIPAVEGLEAYRETAFGYIRIPAMELSLPLYVGASASHMARGAAVLGETSLPVGGENTNCVIAAHRGYRGAAFFRDIEKLRAGDSIELRNPWEHLYYTVEEIRIIGPSDSDAVKLREGRDMLTLLTCHPYRGHGKQRYVVFAIRDEAKAELPETTRRAGTENAGQPERRTNAGSYVGRENLMRKYATLLLIAMCLWVLQSRRNSRRQLACSHGVVGAGREKNKRKK